ncbi:unnamed protein product, partial [marine sediment metagenome]
TYDNEANLARAFMTTIIDKYKGTTAGRQELEGELLDEVAGALWTHQQIEADRIRPDFLPALSRIVVAVDPAVTAHEESDETGIIAVGKDNQNPAHYYVLRDKSLRAKPFLWATAAVNLLEDLDGDRIIAEVNQGGDMVEHTIRMVNSNTPYAAVRASRGKLVRAEPISALYEQRRVHHVGGFAELEDQMCNYVPGDDSPDRMDALVWAMTELSSGAGAIVSTPNEGMERE